MKPEKCEFHTETTKYLGLIIESGGIKMDTQKVETVRNWSAPKTLKDLQAFLEFANFILTRKDTSFSWNPDTQYAFEILKRAFTTVLILAHFDPDSKIIVETDTSDYVSTRILSQSENVETLRPVAYFSKKIFSDRVQLRDL